MAMCVLDEKEYEKWQPGYYQASIALEEREKLIEEEAEKIEKVKYYSLDQNNFEFWIISIKIGI